MTAQACVMRTIKGPAHPALSGGKNLYVEPLVADSVMLGQTIVSCDGATDSLSDVISLHTFAGAERYESSSMAGSFLALLRIDDDDSRNR